MMRNGMDLPTALLYLEVAVLAAVALVVVLRLTLPKSVRERVCRAYDHVSPNHG